MLELKPLKREAEKIRRKERAAQLSSGYAEGTLTEEDKAIFEQRRARGRERRNATKLIKREREGEGDRGDGGIGKSGPQKGVWDGAVIMDLGFDELMTDQVSLHYLSVTLSCFVGERYGYECGS